MVYLKGLFVHTLVTFIFCTICLERIGDVKGTRIAYKKPLYGKSNAIKEKRYRAKVPIYKPIPTIPTITQAPTIPTTISKLPLIYKPTATTMKTITTTAAMRSAIVTPLPQHAFVPTTTTTTTVKPNSDEITAEQQQVEVFVPKTEEIDNLNFDSNESEANSSIFNSKENVEQLHTDDKILSEEEEEILEDIVDKINLLKENTVKEQIEDSELQFQQQIALVVNTTTDAITTTTTTEQITSTTTAATTTTTIATTNKPTTTTSTPTPTTTTTTATTIAVTERNGPVPCTCGIFLTSQIKRGSNEPPQGKPVIVNELDRNFPCNPIGQKQCQTKCLETIVQHLPNSANILCATLNRDCRKERAYLFIKNCRNQWSNTNLAAGREYCCKNGQPYPCPLV